jgi:hypothetical protein
VAGSGSELTSRASMSLKLEPFEGSFEIGDVPREHTRALITICGMIVFVVAGVAGAAWTMAHAPAHDVAWYAGLALAELGLALVAVLIIAPGVRIRPDAEVAGGPGDAEIGAGRAGRDAEPLLDAGPSS